MIVHEARASTILYNLLKSLKHRRVFLLPANICPIVPLTFIHADTPFEFIDISLEELGMDRERALECIRGNPSKYGGVFYVRTYGHASDNVAFFAELKSTAPHLLLVDDCCLCYPRLDDPPGSHADLTLYSTGYAKVVELGFGGYGFLKEGWKYHRQHEDYDSAAVANLEAAYKDAIAKRRRWDYAPGAWLDTRVPQMPLERYFGQIQAARSRVEQHKAELNEIYSSLLPPEIQLPEPFQNWRFHVLVPDKTRLLQDIFDAGLFASSHYASLAGIFDDSTAPHAEQLAASVLNLFNDQYFDAQRARRITEIVNRHLACSVTPMPLASAVTPERDLIFK